MDANRHETNVPNGPRVVPEKKAKQGVFGGKVLLVLIVSIVLAVIAGVVVLSTSDEFTVEQEAPTEGAPDAPATPVVPQEENAG